MFFCNHSKWLKFMDILPEMKSMKVIQITKHLPVFLSSLPSKKSKLISSDSNLSQNCFATNVTIFKQNFRKIFNNQHIWSFWPFVKSIFVLIKKKFILLNYPLSFDELNSNHQYYGFDTEDEGKTISYNLICKKWNCKKRVSH